MYVNNAAVQNQNNGMGPVYMTAGVQQQQPGMMMAPPMQQTQIIINSATDGPDGQPIQT